MYTDSSTLKTNHKTKPLLHTLQEVGTPIPLREMEDDALLVAHQKGSESAFEELVRRYQRNIFSYIYRMLQNKHIAEELTQEVFLALVKNMERYEPQGKFAAYLFAIASNKIHKEWEQRKRRPKFFSLSFWNSDLEATDNGNTPLDTLQDTKACVEEAFKRTEISDAVNEAIKHLPEHYREAFVLRRFLELSYEEIAEMTDLQMNAIRTNLSRARKKVRDEFLKLNDHGNHENKSVTAEIF